MSDVELSGPPATPDANGCFGWPRACEHEDDFYCMEAADDAADDAAFDAGWLPGDTR
jgi:hypothetical protein